MGITSSAGGSITLKKTWGGSPLLSLVTAQYKNILLKTLLEKKIPNIQVRHKPTVVALRPEDWIYTS